MNQSKLFREREHFDNLKVNPLKFLERDRTPFQRAMIRFLLSRWDGHLKRLPKEALAGRKVLDACCGNPRIVLWMAAMGAESFGFDISMGMMTMAGKSGVSYVLGRKVELCAPRWALADCEAMPFPDAAFDTITCFQALHHVDAGRFFSECRRVLGPGGLLFITDPNGEHPLRRLGDRIGRSLGLLTRDEGSYSNTQVHKLLLENGFEIINSFSMNFFSEILFLFEEIYRPRRPALSAFIRASLFFFYPLDAILDKTLFRVFPSLGWRRVWLAVKK